MSAAPTPAADEIRRALSTLFAPTDVIELRAIHKGRKRVDAGYFDAEHRDDLIEASAKLNGSGAAVYVTLNPLEPQILARCANRVQEFAQATATDGNVTRRCWLLVDIDPQRPKDTSSTDSQYELARARGRAIYSYLSERDWPTPVVAHSGNGVHLIYRVDLPNDEESRDLIKHALEALAARFDDDAVKVDRSVFNAARIIKLHGTVATKGDHVPGAPWRLSKLLRVPSPIQAVAMDQLTGLVADAKAAQAPAAVRDSSLKAWGEAEVAAFLARGGIEAAGPEPHDGALRWKLKACPFNPDHGPGEAAVFLRPDGRLGFDCRHNSCTDKHWRDLRILVDGERPQGAAATRPSPHHPGPAEVTTWPAPQPLPDGLPPVDAFDCELLPPILRARVEDIAERMRCPPDFPAVGQIVALSSMIGRRCGIAPKREDDWVVVPNLWGALIGRPGLMKSPPLNEVIKPLQVLQARASGVYDNELADYQAGVMVAAQAERVAQEAIRAMLKAGNTSAAHERAQEIAQRGNAEPTRRRYVINDTTVEKLGEVLNENPYGVLYYRDELNGFFRTLERQGHEADRAFYLECWNGDNGFTYDRIGRGTLHIAGACLSIIGSIQPGPLSDIVRGMRGSGDDGLLQRFQLAVWPDVSGDWRNVDRAPHHAAREAVQQLIERLDRMGGDGETGAIPDLRFSAEAQELFDVWRERLERRLRSDAEPAVVEAHLAKYRSLVPSLALVLHLSEHSQGPVELLALERAIAWAAYLESHARRIYAPAISPDMDAARLLAKRIAKGELGVRFGLRDVYNNGWSGLSERDQVAAAVAVLCDYDWLREITEETGGRIRTAYEVNPGLSEVRS